MEIKNKETEERIKLKEDVNIVIKKTDNRIILNVHNIKPDGINLKTTEIGYETNDKVTSLKGKNDDNRFLINFFHKEEDL